MTRMKHTLPILALLLVLASCQERPAVLRDTIPYVKQIAVDTTGTFALVHSYRTAGTRGSIAVIGEPEAASRLASFLLAADNVDNIDGTAAPAAGFRRRVVRHHPGRIQRPVRSDGGIQPGQPAGSGRPERRDRH